MPRFGSITRIETQQKNKMRVNVYIDGKFAFGANREVAEKLLLREGMNIDQASFAKIVELEEKTKAWNKALNYLSYRPHTEQEMTAYLSKKGFSEETVAITIKRLLEQRLIDDKTFTDIFIRNRLSTKPVGKKYLEFELTHKGVQREVIAERLEASGLEESEDEIVFKLAKQKHKSFQNLEPLARQRRITGFLQRRGFSYQAIRNALARLGELETDEFVEDY